MWGAHLPPPFNNIFNEYNFSIISNLFDNNDPCALNTYKRKTREQNVSQLFGEELRVRGEKIKQNLP